EHFCRWFKPPRSPSGLEPLGASCYFIIKEPRHFTSPNHRQPCSRGPVIVARRGLPIRRPQRNEPITIRHLDLRQTLGVEDVALLDDIVSKEQKGRQSVNLVRPERSRLIWGHGTVGIVPYRRRKPPVTPNGRHRVRGVERAF